MRVVPIKREFKLYPLPKMSAPVYPEVSWAKEDIPHLIASHQGRGAGVITWHIPITGEEIEVQGARSHADD